MQNEKDLPRSEAIKIYFVQLEVVWKRGEKNIGKIKQLEWGSLSLSDFASSSKLYQK